MRRNTWNWAGTGAVAVVITVAGFHTQAQPLPRGPMRAEDARGAKAREWVGLAQQALAQGRGTIETYAWEDIAVTQASFGDINGALKSATTPEDPSDRIRALVAVANVLRERGEIPGAKNTLVAASR